MFPRLRTSALCALIAGCDASGAIEPGAGWRYAEPMPTARSEIQAAVLGERIFVVGGVAPFRTAGACEWLDTATGIWSTCPDLPDRMHHVAMTSCGDRVYAGGGYTSLAFTHDPEPVLWSLQPDEAPEIPRWEEIAPLPEPIGEHLMVCVDSQVFLIGGRALAGETDAVWKLRLGDVDGGWSRQSPLPTPRHSAAAAVIDGEIWVTGGRSERDGSRADAVEVYSPGDDAWRTEPPLPVGRGGHAVAAAGGLLHAIGGEVFDPDEILDRHDVFDPAAGAWSRLDPPPAPRHGAAAAEVGGAIYLIGGGARPGLKTVFSASGVTQIWGPSFSP